MYYIIIFFLLIIIILNKKKEKFNNLYASNYNFENKIHKKNTTNLFEQKLENKLNEINYYPQLNNIQLNNLFINKLNELPELTIHFSRNIQIENKNIFIYQYYVNTPEINNNIYNIIITIINNKIDITYQNLTNEQFYFIPENPQDLTEFSIY